MSKRTHPALTIKWKIFSYPFSCDFRIGYKYYYKEIQIIYSIICMFIEEHTFRNIAFYHIALRPPRRTNIVKYVGVRCGRRGYERRFFRIIKTRWPRAQCLSMLPSLCTHCTHTHTLYFSQLHNNNASISNRYILVFKNFYGQFIFFSVIFLCLRCGRRYVWVVALKRAYMCIAICVVCVCGCAP